MECPDRYSPLFPVDERNGDILWELWIEGFEKARQVTPGSLAKTPQHRCRHDGGDARNDDACRCRARRLPRASHGPRRPDHNGSRRHRALDRHTQCMAARQLQSTARCRPDTAAALRLGEKNWPQRPLSLRLRKEIQKALRASLSAATSGLYRMLYVRTVKPVIDGISGKAPPGSRASLKSIHSGRAGSPFDLGRPVYLLPSVV